ncbi:MAG TPA: energy transducer TonB [Polyangiaceae bacterium]|nr:energy transducer TonB [Polyangiaceae bacterium]
MSHAETVRRSPESVIASDPFAKMLAFDDRGALRFRVSLALTVALYLSLGLRGLAMSTGLGGFADSVFRVLQRSHHTEYEIEPPPPPPPEPEPTPEPEPEVPKEAPPPKAAAAPATPPAAAQAGQVMTSTPDPDEPVDLTGDGFVQGTGDAFAGGVTTTSGTSKSAVRDVKAAGSAEAAAPAVKPSTGTGGPDQSRKAALLGGNSWDRCGFPAEADIEQINNARVTLVVTVDSDGHATNASVSQDPGYGFGALAKRCALRERYSPALNRAGEPVTATQTIVINFRR